MPEPRLTWHAGSVLPYASLWHTVLRACALNALHPRELPSCLPRSPARVELLENDAGGVDVTAFAHALGEAPSVFQWSTLGALPSWLRGALAAPRPRLCLTSWAGERRRLSELGAASPWDPDLGPLCCRLSTRRR